MSTWLCAASLLHWGSRLLLHVSACQASKHGVLSADQVLVGVQTGDQGGRQVLPPFGSKLPCSAPCLASCGPCHSQPAWM